MILNLRLRCPTARPLMFETRRELQITKSNFRQDRWEKPRNKRQSIQTLKSFKTLTPGPNQVISTTSVLMQKGGGGYVCGVVKVIVGCSRDSLELLLP